MLNVFVCDQVACDIVEWPAVPVLTKLIRADALVGTAVGKKRVHVKSIALLNN